MTKLQEGSGESTSFVVLPSAEVRTATDANPDAAPLAQLAIVEIMKTDPNAAFEWPASMAAPSRGVTYTPPTGDE
jgi:hypothetical protein